MKKRASTATIKTEAPKDKPAKKSWFSKIAGSSLFALSAVKEQAPQAVVRSGNPFTPAKPAPGVVPKTHTQVMATDENITAVSKYAMDEFNLPVAGLGGAFQNTALSQGYSFLGYTYLAELTQIPEYRRISEVISMEMTRQWIKFFSVSDDEGKEERIRQVEEEISPVSTCKAAFSA